LMRLRIIDPKDLIAGERSDMHYKDVNDLHELRDDINDEL